MHAWLAVYQALVVLQSPGTVTETPVITWASVSTAPAALTAPVQRAITAEAEIEDQLAEDAAVAQRRASGEGKDTGGGVALVFMAFNPPFEGLNDIAQRMNFFDASGRTSGFGSGPLFMRGLSLFGYAGKHFRIGGMGTEGRITIVDGQADFERDLILRVSQGGVTLEYVYPKRRWELYAGGLIGAGEYELTYVQAELATRNAQQDFDAVTANLAATPRTATFAKRISASFVVANPWIGAKFKVASWFALDASIGWQFGRIGRGQWEFSDSNFTLAGSPAMNASGWTARLSATVGAFPY